MDTKSKTCSDGRAAKERGAERKRARGSKKEGSGVRHSGEGNGKTQ